MWHLSAAELEADARWRAAAGLSPAAARALWEAETTALLAFMGAKAEFALKEIGDVQATRRPASSQLPACRGRLQEHDRTLVCPQCPASCGEVAGYLDFAPTAAMKPGLGPFYLQDPLHVRRYESGTRAAFLDIMGQNWRGALCANDEDAYIREHLGAVDGPVLDLGCGPGRWTRTVCEYVGGDRVIGLDLSVAMLAAIGVALPDLCLVRASALQLPFLGATLGAVNCSNALQLFPDPHLAIAEVGRCLRAVPNRPPNSTFCRPSMTSIVAERLCGSIPMITCPM